MNNNHLKIVTDNASMKPQSQQAMSSSKSSSSGAVTPTSDFVDDSGVSEDTSATSGSEQSGGSIYRSVRTTPKSFATTSSERVNDTIDADDIDDANNNTINKNRTNSNHNQASPVSSIIQLSPGAVIEYKTTVSTVQQKSMVIPNTSSPLGQSSPVIVSVSTHNSIATNGTTNVIKTVSTQQSSTQTSIASTPHTHYHKKYIKALAAMNSGCTETTSAAAITPIPAIITNSNPDAQNALHSTVVSVSTPTTTIYTIPMKTEFR